MPCLALAFRVHTQATASRHDDRTPSRRLGFLVRRRHDSTKNNPRLRHTHTRTRKRCLLLWPVRDFPRCRCLSLPGGFAAGVGKSHQNTIRETRLKQRHQQQNTHTHTHTRTERDSPLAVEGGRGRRERPASLFGAREVVRVLASIHQAADRRAPPLAHGAHHLPPALDLLSTHTQDHTMCGENVAEGGPAGARKGARR